jgi:nucleoside-diphosphate-sugar epimerase
VLGATSFVGQSLLPLLNKEGSHVVAFSRQAEPSCESGNGITQAEFRQLGAAESKPQGERIANWVCLAPIWVLPEYFSMLKAYQVKRIVALGSTSIFTKRDSSDSIEQETVKRLQSGEQRFIAWAEANQIEWVILRPTLIYGLGRDRNICEIARFISRFGFFPLLGSAQGLRQPVYVNDVATACVAALRNKQVRNRAYNLAGAERLTYREMVKRVFGVMGQRERFISIPRSVFGVAIACLRVLPRFHNWSVAMADRMSADLIFDYASAKQDLGFIPRVFKLSKGDLPKSG